MFRICDFKCLPNVLPPASRSKLNLATNQAPAGLSSVLAKISFVTCSVSVSFAKQFQFFVLPLSAQKFLGAASKIVLECSCPTKSPSKIKKNCLFNSPHAHSVSERHSSPTALMKTSLQQRLQICSARGLFSYLPVSCPDNGMWAAIQTTTYQQGCAGREQKDMANRSKGSSSAESRTFQFAKKNVVFRMRLQYINQ